MIKLTLDVSPGSLLEDACRTAQYVADEIGAQVTFEFNGIECVALPGGRADTLAERQNRAQGRRLRVVSLEDTFDDAA